MVEAGRQESTPSKSGVALPANSHSAEELKLRLASLQNQLAEQVDPEQDSVGVLRIAAHLPPPFLTLLSLVGIRYLNAAGNQGA